ncbi:baseplate hub protein [Acinetobacter larvae]|uniref:Uncharacterized protein n=1 Tax=Acinetobacter larvae TaxID=1789224 RepID=A0A1B2LZG7_9GAMM|nr:hypothetical protein [Acinetobacter larvae]AOA58336.1 hypothetical protein BFG52_08195 [Acinetobacter larvae]
MNKKIIKVSVMLNDDNFNDSGDNTLTFTGLKTSVSVMFGNGALMPFAQIKIYGLKLENCLKLLRVRWNEMKALMNRVRIDAGEEGGDLVKVFEGNITFAYPDMSNAPNVALVIESQSAVFENMKPVPSTSFEGENDVATMIETICKDMGYQFENNAVTQIIEGQYLADSSIAKIQNIAQAADIDLYIEQNLIAIAPKGGSRNIKVPTISPKAGLIGYPTPDLRGVSFKCLYDPAIRFGGTVSISDSEITVCNGDWRVYGVDIYLDSNTPNGNWFCEVNATFKDSANAVKK